MFFLVIVVVAIVVALVIIFRRYLALTRGSTDIFNIKKNVINQTTNVNDTNVNGVPAASMATERIQAEQQQYNFTSKSKQDRDELVFVSAVSKKRRHTKKEHRVNPDKVEEEEK